MPHRPVKAGQSWEIDAAAFDRKDVEDIQVKGKITLLSVDTLQGVKVAKIKETVDITGDLDTKRHIETTALVEVATGKLLNFATIATGKSSVKKSAISDFNGEITMKRLGPNEKVETKEAVKTNSDINRP